MSKIGNINLVDFNLYIYLEYQTEPSYTLLFQNHLVLGNPCISLNQVKTKRVGLFA